MNHIPHRPADEVRPEPAEARYEDAFLLGLFRRMEPTYGLVNFLSSLGFCTLWRRECVRNVEAKPGQRVCDMMAGSGECWRYLPADLDSLVSIDFCPEMIARQRRRQRQLRRQVEVLRENALHTPLKDDSVDCVICAFGLKTLSPGSRVQFAREIHRVLKPGGRFSVIEVSTAEGWPLAPLFLWYVNRVIPWIGRLCLGDIECYRLLGIYTRAFGSCHTAIPAFEQAGLQVSVRTHFYGCATSLVGSKPGLPPPTRPQPAEAC